MSHTVSFCILDDLNPAYGPVHEFINTDLTMANIEESVRKILGDFLKSGDDPSGYYHEEISESEIKSIVSSLFEKKYYVINRFDKYYVIAFALDYTRFEIFSKDCDKELMKWRPDCENDPITGIITDDDYNLNPIIKCMQQFGNK